MNISFITILNDSISKQKVFVNITSNKNETESIMNNSSLIVTLNNSSLIVTVNNSSIVIADENTITSNTTDVQAELMRRRMLLKELSNTSEKSKEILDEIDTKKEFTKKLSTRKKKLKLENLSTNFRKKLKKQALNKILSSWEKKEMNIIVNEKTYHVKFIIKYLHSCTRFVLKNSARSFSVLDSSTKLVKSTSNIKMTRIFCDIVKNSAKNKRWKREHHKIVVENLAFLLLLDKKSSSDMSIEQKNSEDVFYHYINSFDFWINHSKVWFIETLNTSKKRFRKAQKTIKAHMQWKI